MPHLSIDDVLTRRRDLTLNRDADGLAELYAPDAVIEMPFAGPPGSPMRLTGREAIRAYTRKVVESPVRVKRYEVAACHWTDDPEVVVLEMRAEVTPNAVGHSITATSIQVLRIKDGQIVLFRDYANPRIQDELAAQQ
ncbi:nuclear transport factor 2 family protein [Microlunatus sp. Gsoil 973]|uniref:nuclear transport factor 2 family protein n=1 Tax=Microlunatus sp. Gsoil 973 TaxID=2672569 RepID=UPI0012B4FC0D|nr:nuclear transport factor 2 family protein [Microlunatus sp. Gsoil 973]QGN32609.1 nuclear transport factor 2 family protein [Microlunatus sp. Gsoil 973]